MSFRRFIWVKQQYITVDVTFKSIFLLLLIYKILSRENTILISFFISNIFIAKNVINLIAINFYVYSVQKVLFVHLIWTENSNGA